MSVEPAVTLTSYQRLVQSVCCHADWDADDHAMYLWSEHLMRDGGKDEPDYADLVDWCVFWLKSSRLAADVASALDSVS